MWSLFYAYKIFDYIKEKNGLLDEKIGKKLSEEILSLGNTIDAKDMINNFLK